MTFKFKPPKRKKFKTTISPSLVSDSKTSLYKLRLMRVILIILAVAVAAAAIFVGIHFLRNDSERATSADYNAFAENQNAELLRVVNKSNPLDKNYVPKLVEKDGYQVSVLAEKSLDEMLADAKKQGISLYVKYAYVSYAEQKKKYNDEFKRNIEQYGLSEVKAQAKTNVVIPQAGRSENQTGLLISFRSEQSGKFENSTASDWLSKNAKNYGFVLRYPPDKTAETSMNANAKSYRYVGKDNAEVMQSLNMCLNEYSYYISSRNN
ncbi:MAG: M15 family metallopeptidase [Ruminococcus sp.]|nr:M15 family metallopeptidase [Ruminococcus sp.]